MRGSTTGTSSNGAQKLRLRSVRSTGWLLVPLRGGDAREPPADLLVILYGYHKRECAALLIRYDDESACAYNSDTMRMSARSGGRSAEDSVIGNIQLVERKRFKDAPTGASQRASPLNQMGRCTTIHKSCCCLFLDFLDDSSFTADRRCRQLQHPWGPG